MSIPGFMRVYNDGVIPKADSLIKIHDTTGCSLTWLLTGKGQAFSGQASLVHTHTVIESPTAWDTLGNPVDIDEFVFVPRYNVKAAAGNGHYTKQPPSKDGGFGLRAESPDTHRLNDASLLRFSTI